MSLRNPFQFAALVAVIVTLAADARAVDPAVHPTDRDQIVPQPYDPLFPKSNPSGFGNPGAFDPFAPSIGPGTLPNSGLGAIPSSNSLDQLRVNPQLHPGPPQETPRWRLGIYSTDTGTGVQVVQVTQGSPADAAGLEKNDLIIAVAGYQVGLIENTRRELGQVFNEHAGTDGHVNLLVQDNRSRNLTNLHVHLESRFQRIEGTVTFGEQVRLPRNAQLRIDLYETVRQGVTIPIVTKTITDWRQTPIPFTIDYDPSLIDPRREYNLHASVVAENHTYYLTRNPYRVITDGYPRVADLRLYSASGNYGPQDGGYASHRDDDLEQIIAWYREYLNRDIRPNERQVYTSSVDRGESLDEIRAQLLGLPEFYNKSGRDDQDYIRNLYAVVLNRNPTQQEINAWLRQLEAQNGIRTNLAREFLAAVSKQR